MERKLSETRKLKICFVSEQTSVHIKRWVNFFIKRGHHVFLITNKKFEFPGLVVFLVEPKTKLPILRYFSKARQVVRLIRAVNPDVVHIHYLHGLAHFATFSGVHPLVVTVWGSDMFRIPLRKTASLWRDRYVLMNRWLDKYTLSRADLITGISAPLLQQAVSLGADENKTMRIQFGVDLDKFKPGLDVSVLRGELGLGDSPVVLSPRHMAATYNIDIVLESIPLVLAECPRAKFVLLKGYGNLKDKYEARARELGVEKDVKIIDLVNYEEMPYFYNVADVVISVPSRDGGTPVSALEAMACGTPVVVSDLPTIKEFLEDGRNALLVPARDAKSLGEAVIRLLKDKNMSKKFASLNLDLIREEADTQKEFGKVERKYYQLISQLGNSSKEFTD